MAYVKRVSVRAETEGVARTLRSEARLSDFKTLRGEAKKGYRTPIKFR